MSYTGFLNLFFCLKFLINSCHKMKIIFKFKCNVPEQFLLEAILGIFSTLLYFSRANFLKFKE